MSGVFLPKGIAIGLAIAAPVGPIGVLCIRRSLSEGQKAGFATGLGAAAADAIYGGVAAFGLTAISNFLVQQKSWLSLIGGLFLCYLGFNTFRSKPAAAALKAGGTGLIAAFFSTLALTLANPMTILSFVAVFAGFGLGTSSDYLGAGTLVAGVFLGSAFWWLLLSSGVSLFSARITSDWMLRVNRLPGVIIFAFGLYSLSTLFKH
jgi:threonine/homoserine/homoserine lactone efflux protein